MVQSKLESTRCELHAARGRRRDRRAPRSVRTQNMRVDVSMIPKDDFHVSSWWAGSPELVLNALQRQLEAASVIWPELSGFKIEKPRSHSKARVGIAGGVARAASLSSERRSEIASEAAKARWGVALGKDASK